jgi:hypothetical protein
VPVSPSGPALRLLEGEEGLAHVLFSDMACWHGQEGQTCQQGQIRHAGRYEGSWSLTTLLRQVVNPASSLHRMSLRSVGEAGEAEGLYVFALEGSPENTGWTGSWTHLRLHASESVIASDGFESGDLSSWSD